MKEQGLFGQVVIAQLLFGLMSFSFRLVEISLHHLFVL